MHAATGNVPYLNCKIDKWRHHLRGKGQRPPRNRPRCIGASYVQSRAACLMGNCDCVNNLISQLCGPAVAELLVGSATLENTKCKFKCQVKKQTCLRTST
jgi:hypothetical protein